MAEREKRQTVKKKGDKMQMFNTCIEEMQMDLLALRCFCFCCRHTPIPTIPFRGLYNMFHVATAVCYR